MDNRAALLLTCLRNRIREPNAEAGYERFATVAVAPLSLDAFHHEVAGCVAHGLLREPVRLPEGSLQCHWHLELTPAGVAAAQKVMA
jgi:hypothetical protein